MRRAVLALLLTVALAPGTWLRSPLPPFTLVQELTERRVPLPPGCCSVGPLHLERAWHLTSRNQQFGGYSALVRPASGRLLAISDAGYTLDFPEPGLPGPVHLSTLFPKGPPHKEDRDTEAAQWDPARHQLWVASEGRNLVMRFGRDLHLDALRSPSAMAHWPLNTGPEAMARWPDGRFAVLCECASRWHDDGAHPLLLFPGDPISSEPVRIWVTSLPQFRPTDMAVLPDGRLLVLQRELVWPFPVRFSARLGLLDLNGVKPGQVVALQDLGEFPEAIPMDNYEGLALEPLDNGRMAAWVISDDNHAAFQRTLLLEFEFALADLPTKQKAPG